MPDASCNPDPDLVLTLTCLAICEFLAAPAGLCVNADGYDFTTFLAFVDPLAALCGARPQHSPPFRAWHLAMTALATKQLAYSPHPTAPLSLVTPQGRRLQQDHPELTAMAAAAVAFLAEHLPIANAERLTLYQDLASRACDYREAGGDLATDFPTLLASPEFFGWRRPPGGAPYPQDCAAWANLQGLHHRFQIWLTGQLADPLVSRQQRSPHAT